MTLFLNNIKRKYREKTSLVLIVLLPVLLMVLQINAVSIEVKATVGVAWEESNEYTRIFKECLESQYELIDIKKEDASKEVINMNVDCAFVVYEGFTSAVIEGKEPSVDMYILQESNISVLVKYYIGSFIEASNALGKACKGNEEVFYKGLNEYVDGKMKLEYKNFDSKTQDSELASRSLGFLALGLMYFMGLSTSMILTDRKQHIYDKILASPATAAQYTIANLTSYAVLGLLQLAVLFPIMSYGLNVKFGDNVCLIFLICYLFSITNMAMGIFFSSVCKDMAQVNACTALVNMPLLMLGGCFFPIQYMPTVIQRIAKFLPTNWFMVSVDSVLNGKGITEVYPYILLLVGFSVVVTGITFTIRKITNK